MKILLVNAYAQNTGDAALLSVLISQLRKQWPGCQIIISSLEDPDEHPEFDGCVNIGSIRLYAGAAGIHKFHRILHKILVLIVEIVWPSLPKKLRGTFSRLLPGQLGHELRELANSDLVISPGGGYVNAVDSLAGDLNIRYLLLPLKLAEKIHKPVILAPQSFGPFGNKRQEGAVKKILNRTECVLVRENKSYNLLASIGIDKKLLVRAVDSGFAFDTNITNNRKTAQRSSMKIGITARSWLSKTKQESYELALAGFIVATEKNHQAEISLIPQVTSSLYLDDDRIVERRIACLARSSGAKVAQIDSRLDHHRVKQLYARHDFTIGTRFHSVIFSLTSYVPAIAIEYEHKTSSIMQDLGLQKWVINIEDVTADRLSSLFRQLVNERQAYLAHLHKVLPAYIRKADEAGGIIKQAYEHSKYFNDIVNQAE